MKLLPELVQVEQEISEATTKHPRALFHIFLSKTPVIPRTSVRGCKGVNTLSLFEETLKNHNTL
ncbi:hypothetical protein ADH67_06445 [Turicimonas muris]|uniref:Uncharacterized protein n=1 Tax=Turicimonas muris TaxID=1796652 RepID=A0A227KQY0_9BURK|nr:hypothetical protein ADH67_06445 [Turicimonas muris]